MTDKTEDTILVPAVSEFEWLEALQPEDSLELTTRLLDNIGDSVTLMDCDGKILYTNEIFCGSCGDSRKEIAGTNICQSGFETIPGLSGSRYQEILEKGELKFESVHNHKDGSISFMDIHARVIEVNERKLILSIGRDITERKLAENEKNRLLLTYKDQNRIVADLNRKLEKTVTLLSLSQDKLRSSKQHFWKLLDESNDAVFICDSKGAIIDVNRGGCDLLGYFKNNLLNQSISSLIPTGERRAFARALGANIGEGTSRFETKFQRADGQIINTDISSKVIDPEKGITKIIARDITELKKTQDQLQQSQILASLGSMTAGIAHEVNNPLGSILLYSELLMKSEDSNQNKKDLKIIHSEAKRAARILTGLLTYGKGVKPQMRRLNLHKIVRDVLKMRRYADSVQNTVIFTHLLGGPLYITGSPTQLTQVFMNIMLNAEEALREKNGGSIIVTSQIENDWAILSVSDDGCGIAEEHLRQVFHPFFTTKQIGEGTGLGLSACYNIVTAHGGLIHVENNEMGGATFIVELPLRGKPKERKQDTK